MAADAIKAPRGILRPEATSHPPALYAPLPTLTYISILIYFILRYKSIHENIVLFYGDMRHFLRLKG